MTTCFFLNRSLRRLILSWSKEPKNLLFSESLNLLEGHLYILKLSVK